MLPKMLPNIHGFKDNSVQYIFSNMHLFCIHIWCMQLNAKIIDEIYMKYRF